MDDSPRRHWTVECAFLSIRLAGRLMPRARRGGFRAEWEAELHHWHRRVGGEPWLVLRSLGAFPHALWILADEWMLESLRQDLRFALRSATRAPGYTLAAVGTLALGIGAATALFSVVDGVLLRPLAFPSPECLVRVFETHLDQGIAAGSVTPATYRDFAERNRAFVGMGAYQAGWSYVVEVGGESALVPGARVFPQTFEVLGVRAAMGRTFEPPAESPGDARAAVVSHGLWQRRFGGDPGAIGARIRVEGEPVTIVGVMPPSFAFPDESVELWMPYNLREEQFSNRRSHLLQVIARLRPGSSVERAGDELSRIMARLVDRHPREMEGAGVRIVSLREAVVGDVRPTLRMLFGAVVLLLAIACCNGGGLGLARSRTREREVAVRAALGAGGARIGRLLLAESALVALLAGMVGVAFARLATPLLLAGAPARLPRASEVGIDLRVLGFASLVSLAAALVSGALPALRLASQRVGEVLKRGRGRGSTGRDRSALDALVIAEVAFSVVLLIAAGLVLRSYSKLRAVDPGFTTRDAVSVSILPTEAAYPDVASQTALYDRIVERVRALPAVRDVGLVSELPLQERASTWSFLVEGRPPEEGEVDVHWNPASPGYFRAMRIPLLGGRWFDDRDRAGDPPVVVIDETIVRRFFADSDPLGARIRMSPEGRLHTVVGVAGAVRHAGLREDHRLTMYTPHAQNTEAWRRDMTLVARIEGPLEPAVSSIEGAVRRVDPALALDRAQPLDQVLEASLGADRLRLWILAGFAGLALLLTVAGLYGTLTYAVIARTRELAIRAALGARPLRLFASVVRRGMTLVAWGGAAGILLAVGAGRFLRAILFGVGAFDPLTVLGVSATVVAASFLASGMPALRTVRRSPAAALSDDRGGGL